ncbi:hypothetical protein QYF36_025864 [Acer negundo]|nr:hypothetical protein QYF36_025864 [Acer negundo]
MALRGMYNNFFDLICHCFSPVNVKEIELFYLVVWRTDFVAILLSMKLRIIICLIWIPHDKDAYKANCDVVLDHVNGLVGVDMVIRNLDGLVL